MTAAKTPRKDYANSREFILSYARSEMAGLIEYDMAPTADVFKRAIDLLETEHAQLLEALATARADALEEAAKVCDDVWNEGRYGALGSAAATCALTILAKVRWQANG